MARHKYDNDPRYLNIRIGVNSRLDAIQAAILSEKLKIYPDELQRRDAVAARYSKALGPHVRCVPKVIEGGFSNWAQYTIEHDNRDALAAHLKTKGVPTAIYYPIPIHMQDVYSRYPRAPGGLPATEAARHRVLSLPMHPYLDPATQDQVIDAIRGFNAR
jgi:dTDP-4-amino-4,6-dideoxygalactose transaminase